jgi:hypothetical protein
MLGFFPSSSVVITEALLKHNLAGVAGITEFHCAIFTYNLIPLWTPARRRFKPIRPDSDNGGLGPVLKHKFQCGRARTERDESRATCGKRKRIEAAAIGFS